MKKLSFVFFLSLVVCSFSFAIDMSVIDQKTKDINSTISDAMITFSKQLPAAIPVSITQQNIWSDAYIGQLISLDGLNFGLGASISATIIDSGPLGDAAKQFVTSYKDSMELVKNGVNEIQKNTPGFISVQNAINIPSIEIPFDKAPYPSISADARIGGFILPFDVGFSFMKIPAIHIDAGLATIDVDFLNTNADLRYALLHDKDFLPIISVGAGYAYTNGNIVISANGGSNNFGLSYETHAAYAEAQISKEIFFITPYFGIKEITSQTIVNWNWEYTLDFGAANGQLENLGIDRVYKDSGKDTSQFGSPWQTQLFAGIGFNALLTQTTIGVSYTIPDNLWAGSFSFRIKI